MGWLLRALLPTVWWAALLAAAGAALVIAGLSEPGGRAPGLVVSGFILLLSGGTRLARAWLSPAPAPGGEDDPAPQVAGAACAACRDKITSDLDGGVCGKCMKPIHTGCRRAHRRTDHTRRVGAYR